VNENIQGSRLRWAHECMFSLNLGWTIVWIERVQGKILGGNVLSRYVSSLVRGAYQLVSPIGGYTILEQLVWSFALAAVFFLLLRLLSRFTVVNAALRTIAGVVAIVGFPLAGTLVPFGFISAASRIDAYHRGLFLEVIIVVICAVLYYRRKPLFSMPLIVLVVLLHFGVWTWITSSYVNVPAFITDLRSSEYYHPWRRTLGSLSLAMAFNFGFPILGFLASITWACYVRSFSER